MKASRLTAVGLVAAAGLWIASGHFLPHESAESRAAVRSGEGEAKRSTILDSCSPDPCPLTASDRRNISVNSLFQVA